MLTVALIFTIVMCLFAARADSKTARSNPALARHVAQVVFGTRWRAAYCIMGAESHWDPRAVSRGGGNWGWFQINVVHRGWVDWSRVLDPWYNARVAYRLSRGGTSWGPWTTRRLCGL